MGFRRARGLLALLFKSWSPAQHGRVSSSSLHCSAPSPSITTYIGRYLIQVTYCFIPCSLFSGFPSDLSVRNCATSTPRHRCTSPPFDIHTHTTHPHGVLPTHSVPNQIIHNNNPHPIHWLREQCHDLACLQPPPCRANSSSKTNPQSKAPTSLHYLPPPSKPLPADDPPSQIISLRLQYLPISWRWVVVLASSLLLLVPVPELELVPSVRWRTSTCLRRQPVPARLSR